MSKSRTSYFGFYFSFIESFVFKQQLLFYRIAFLSVTSGHRVQCPRVGLEVKISTSSDFFSSLLEPFLFEQQVLLRVDFFSVTLDLGV